MNCASQARVGFGRRLAGVGLVCLESRSASSSVMREGADDWLLVDGGRGAEGSCSLGVCCAAAPEARAMHAARTARTDFMERNLVRFKNAATVGTDRWTV